jgi:hypothetical protein
LLISGWPQFWWAWRYVIAPLAERVMPDTQREVDASWHFLFNRLAALNHHLVEGREEAFLCS